MYGRKAVSAVEVIVAVVILGLLVALAIPRFTRAAAHEQDARLRGCLKVLRVAIERYYQDHHAFPGQHGDGSSPAASPATFVAQLTKFTDQRGRVSDVKDALHRFGPYLRDGVPQCPVPPHLGRAGVHVIRGGTAPAFADQAAEAGWVYNCQTGQIVANSNATDSTGRSYLSY